MRDVLSFTVIHQTTSVAVLNCQIPLRLIEVRNHQTWWIFDIFTLALLCRMDQSYWDQLQCFVSIVIGENHGQDDRGIDLLFLLFSFGQCCYTRQEQMVQECLLGSCFKSLLYVYQHYYDASFGVSTISYFNTLQYMCAYSFSFMRCFIYLLVEKSYVYIYCII